MALTNDQQQVAQAFVGDAFARASASFLDLGSQVGEYIQRGPQGVSWLCFVGGVLNIAFSAATIFNIFDVLFEPLEYLISMYQLMFGLGTCIIEAPQEWGSNNVAKIQKFIHEHAKFLTTFGGRGLFYLFQGSLVLSLGDMFLSIVIGCYMFLLGVVCIAMQYGFLKDARGDHRGDYIHVTG